jgi:hypothetical protein
MPFAVSPDYMRELGISQDPLPGEVPTLRLPPSAAGCHPNTGWIGRAGRPSFLQDG